MEKVTVQKSPKRRKLTKAQKTKLVAATATGIILVSMGVWQRALLVKLIKEMHARYLNFDHEAIVDASKIAVASSYMLPPSLGGPLRKIANFTKATIRGEQSVRKNLIRSSNERARLRGLHEAELGHGPGYNDNTRVFCPIGGLPTCNIAGTRIRDRRAIQQHVFSKHDATAAARFYPNGSISHKRDGSEFKKLVTNEGAPHYVNP